MNIQQKTATRVSSSSLPQDATPSDMPESRTSYADEAGEATVKKGLFRKIFNFLGKNKLLVITIAIVITAGYSTYERYYGLDDVERAQKELENAVSTVSKLMILPEGDEPILAAVTDAEALIKQQAFFTGAINGDQLLLFPKSMKAVIYSPSRGMIVNAGPIEQAPAQTQANAADKPQNKDIASAEVKENKQTGTENVLTVEIRNGTEKTGYASLIAQQLSANAGYKILRIADSAKKDYEKNVVVNLKNDKSKVALANSLASTLGASVDSRLPDGEEGTDADVLVILGGK